MPTPDVFRAIKKTAFDDFEKGTFARHARLG